MTLLSLPRVRPVGGVPDNRFPGDPAASGSPPLGSDPGEKVAAVTVEHFENFLAVSARVTPGSPSLASSNVLVQCSVTPACLSACFKPQESSLFNTLLILPVCACSKSYTHKYSSSTFVCSKKNPSVWWLLYCPACYKKKLIGADFCSSRTVDWPTLLTRSTMRRRGSERVCTDRICSKLRKHKFLSPKKFDIPPVHKIYFIVLWTPD